MRVLAHVLLALALATPALMHAADTRMNPDLSLNGLFEYRAGNRGNDPAAAEPNGLRVRELELQLASDIDPTLRGTALLSISQDPTGAWGLEPEEAYVESLSVPAVTLKGGKFKAALGRANGQHAHAWPFVDAPLANAVLLGDEGYTDVGLSASLLIPAPFFLELTGQAFQANDPALFGSPTPEDAAGLGSLRALWDLSDDATLELQASTLAGRNAKEEITWFGNGAATFKWRHDEAHAFILAGELLHRELNAPAPLALDAETGASAWAQWQFARRWWLEGRGEDLWSQNPVDPQIRKYSALIAYAPSEFSGWRLQYDWVEARVQDPEHKLTLQLNVAMGVHPAHAY
jgi:hypothetical protein